MAAFEGAQRVLRFQLQQGHRLTRAMPMRSSAPRLSPYLGGASD
jgi:hypothetical protein